MLVDLLITLFIISSIYRNWGQGFLRPFWASVGFFIGLLIGRWLETLVISSFHTTTSRALITLACVLGAGLIGLTIGEYFGLKLKHRWFHSKFNAVDNSLGGIFSIVMVLLSVWLLSAVINALPFIGGIKGAVKQSYIVSSLDRLLPPVPNVISDLGRIIDPNGFPDVFIGSEPVPGNVNLPSLGSLAAAVNKDKASVVRIEGLGCGGIVSGSGFVVGNNLVATNAHVVAGIAQPLVDDISGRHDGTVVYFDPNLDLAVLRVNHLASAPLTLDSSIANPNTPAAVLGYPGGGSFTADPAAVIQALLARGNDIYGNGITIRSIYEIQANVIPGNSGGPIIEQNGHVLGVVFAQSTSYTHVGYALTMPKVSSEISSARNDYTPLSTGQCAE